VYCDDFVISLQFFIFAIRYKNGAVAQLVEQRTENPCVGGSIPPHTTETLAVMLGFFVFWVEVK